MSGGCAVCGRMDVRETWRGDMHHGQDYPCTGSAHWSGYHIRCTTPIHGQGPLPLIGFMPKGDFR